MSMKRLACSESMIVGKCLEKLAPRQVPAAVISLGWTTGLSLHGAKYTDEHIQTMADIAQARVAAELDGAHRNNISAVATSGA